MSATDQMRQMINELMGTDPASADSEDLMPFSDHRVCKSFLLACCPHEVLASTRMDMGECPKFHHVALRADFEKSRASDDKDYFYDLDAFEHLERFFEDCDRKMEIAKKRLAETQEELSQEATEKADKVLELNEFIGKTLAEAERLGEEGKVDESLKLMEKTELLRKDKQEADQEYRGSMPASSYQQQKLRVCEICSAYLGIHDNDRRLADHFGGKLHMGFVFLREKLAELRETAEERKTQRDAARRDRVSSYRSYGTGGRNKEDDSERDRKRGGGYSGRSRSRSRSRDKSRSYRNSRDDRYNRDRRDRDRDRDRDQRRPNSNRSDSWDRQKEKKSTDGRNGKVEDNTRLSDVDD